MQEVQRPENVAGKHKRIRHRNPGIHIDSTPMADLAFLLLTFFILTTTFARLRTMDVTMPVEGPPTLTPESRTITFLLGPNDRIYWYTGLTDQFTDSSVHLTDHSKQKNGIPMILSQRNSGLLKQIQLLDDSVKKGFVENIPEIILAHRKQLKNADESGPIVMIKTSDEARYQNLVSMLNEMLRFEIPRYAIVELTSMEKQFLTRREVKSD